MIVCENGEFIHENDLKISSSNRSFLYGDAIFETMRLYKGKLLFAQRHFDRFSQSSKTIQITIPQEISDAKKIRELIIELSLKNKCDNARVKLFLYRNEAGKYSTPEVLGSFLIFLEKMNGEPFLLHKKGLQIGVYEENKKGLGSLSGIKSTSALLQVMAGKYAISKKLDEAIIMNTRDELCEGISSNLFLIQKDKILTPPLSSACLPGVMRSVIIDLCHKHSVKLVQKILVKSDLDNCDEMFMTNAISGIQWVGGYRTKRFYSKKTREIHKLLLSTIT